jgi:hypothetical protein
MSPARVFALAVTFWGNATERDARNINGNFIPAFKVSKSRSTKLPLEGNPSAWPMKTALSDPIGL